MCLALFFRFLQLLKFSGALNEAKHDFSLRYARSRGLSKVNVI